MHQDLKGQVGTCVGPNKYGTPSLTSHTLLSINKDSKYLSYYITKENHVLGPLYYQDKLKLITNGQ